MEWKPDAPRLWYVEEVFLCEDLRGCLSAVAWERKLVWHRGEAGQDAGGIQYRVSFGESVEIQEEEVLAVEHDVLEVWIVPPTPGAVLRDAQVVLENAAAKSLLVADVKDLATSKLINPLVEGLQVSPEYLLHRLRISGDLELG